MSSSFIQQDQISFQLIYMELNGCLFQLILNMYLWKVVLSVGTHVKIKQTVL